MKPSPSPWSFIPTLYFPCGMMGVLGIWQIMGLFKVLGYSNTAVSLVGGLGFVGAFRFLYAPWLDGIASKRSLALVTQGLAVVLYGVIGAIIGLRPPPAVFLWILLPVLLLLAFVAAANETAIDGFYIRALDEKLQAQFIGVKTAGYRVGSLFVSLVVGWIGARIAAHYGAVVADSPDKTGFYISNAMIFGSMAVLAAFFLFFNWRQAPALANDLPVRHSGFALGEMLKDYFSQKSIGLICALIVFYRFGEGFLSGMMGPFSLDPVSKGGMGLPISSGPLMGAIGGMPMMIIGGILGGFLIKRFGLRRTFIPLALSMSLPNLGSVFLAIFQPTAHFLLFGEQIFTWLLLASILENLTYGMSFSAIAYYITVMASESGRNKTSILAVSTALQSVSFYLPMMLSGPLHSLVGYTGVFLASVLGGLPAVFLIPHLPMPRSECGEASGEHAVSPDGSPDVVAS
ncbi:MAG: hypothetical protein IAE94_01155 [Chthoniobacterales bacterium]|nr:hypothetical protein [Chthoniobacterales bacterium]